MGLTSPCLVRTQFGHCGTCTGLRMYTDTYGGAGGVEKRNIFQRPGDLGIISDSVNWLCDLGRVTRILGVFIYVCAVSLCVYVSLCPWACVYVSARRSSSTLKP